MEPANKQYRFLIENLPDAYACLHININEEGEPEDCVIVNVNPAFEELACQNKHELIGRKAAENLPEPENGTLNWMSIYRLVETTGEALTFNQFNKKLEDWHKVTTFSDQPGYLSVIYHDITAQRKTKELYKNEKRFHSLVGNLQGGIVVEDEDHNIILANQAFCDMFYLPAHPEVLVGSSFTMIAERIKHHLNDPDSFLSRIKEIISKHRTDTGEELYFEDGRVLERDYIPVYGENHQLIGHMWHYRDITRHKQAELELREKEDQSHGLLDDLKKSEEKYRQILSTIEEGYYEIDMAGRFVFFNDPLCNILGYETDELMHKSYRMIFKNPDEVFKTFKRVYRSKKSEKTVGWPVITKQGQELYIEASVSLRRDNEEGITGFKGIARDITERKRYEEKLEYLSLHDHLTGLYNRAFFVEEINRLSASREHPITIISADLDKLKLINDTMGHARGDELLKACAKAMDSSLRSSDILARVGGDEFAVLLPRTDEKTGTEIAARIRSGVKLYNQEHPELPLSISIGLAAATGKETHLEEIYKMANDLMLRDKLTHRSSTNRELIETMVNALDHRDYLATGHAERLSAWSKTMGEKLGLSNNQMTNLNLLARIHDLGKVTVPDSILFKNSPLNSIEWGYMHQHPEKGCSIATSSPEYAKVANLIYKHHERWDGSGYPIGLKKEEIPLEGRILAIADAFDVMTSDRPYRKALSKEEAVKELKACAGKQFDPELVKVFIEIIKNGEYDL